MIQKQEINAPQNRETGSGARFFLPQTIASPYSCERKSLRADEAHKWLLFTAIHASFAKLAATQLLHPALRCAFCSCGWSSCFAVRFGSDEQLLMCKHNESVHLSKSAVNSNHKCKKINFGYYTKSK